MGTCRPPVARAGIGRDHASPVHSPPGCATGVERQLSERVTAMHKPCFPRVLSFAATAMCLLIGARADATWSVVGVNANTREVGIAGTSCIDGVEIIVGLAPDHGAIAAQAQINVSGRNEGVMLLEMGKSPQEVIDAIANNTFDPEFPGFSGSSLRQYGVVALGFDDASVAFTGAGTMAWAGHEVGYGVTAQGNILSSNGEQMMLDAVSAFDQDSADCLTLADRLLAALEAAKVIGHDTRCSDDQDALSAVLRVARPEDSADAPYLDIVIDGQPQGGANPIELLRQEYDVWRMANPPSEDDCYEPGPGGSTTDGGSSDSGTDGTDATGSSTDGGSSTQPTSASEGSSASGSTSESTAGSPPESESESESGSGIVSASGSQGDEAPETTSDGGSPTTAETTPGSTSAATGSSGDGDEGCTCTISSNRRFGFAVMLLCASCWWRRRGRCSTATRTGR